MGFLWFVITIVVGTVVLMGINKIFTIIHFGFKSLITFVVFTNFVIGYIVGMMLGTLSNELINNNSRGVNLGYYLFEGLLRGNQ